MLPRKTDVAIARWATCGLYGRLLRAGIEVWEYLPTMLHSKLAVVDDTVVTGSANLDLRSGRINYELVAAARDRDLAAKAKSDFEEDLKNAVCVSYAEWRRRSFLQKLMERLSYCLLARADLFVARTRLARMKW